MAFVYSNWYIVMALLVVGIIALVTTFILMDKKDVKLIDEFIKASSQPNKDETPKETVAETENQKS